MDGKCRIDRQSYFKDGSLKQFHQNARELFLHYGERLEKVKALAQEISKYITDADPFIQGHTEAVCPDCQKVCCINKHAYHEHEDIIYLYALGRRIPSYEEDRDDSEPCQFLGRQGCTISRALRPYRCTWYFCTPLLEHMQDTSAVEYRKFIALLEQITRKRDEMLNTYVEVLCSVHE
jgi:hypothetical protein